MKLQVIGNIIELPPLTARTIMSVVRESAENDGMVLNIALSYGGRAEIVSAVKNIIKKPPKEITEEIFSQFLYTSSLPDPDLLIRSSGEKRLSNFLLWQCAYTEFYFTDVLWPDFGPENLFEAIIHYQNRARRYGKVESGAKRVELSTLE